MIDWFKLVKLAEWRDGGKSKLIWVERSRENGLDGEADLMKTLNAAV